MAAELTLKTFMWLGNREPAAHHPEIRLLIAGLDSHNIAGGVVLRPMVVMDPFHGLISTVTLKSSRRTIFGEKFLNVDMGRWGMSVLLGPFPRGLHFSPLASANTKEEQLWKSSNNLHTVESGSLSFARKL